MDNITLRNPEISQEKVIEAARLIGMHDFTMRLPGGYDHKCDGTRDYAFAGAAAAAILYPALLYNPSILILDEATSSVDTESEQLIQQGRYLIQGRTDCPSPVNDPESQPDYRARPGRDPGGGYPC